MKKQKNLMGDSFLLAPAVKKKKNKKLRSKVVEFQGIKRRRRRRRSSRKRVVFKADPKLCFIAKIPDDLLMAILLKLPAKAVASFILVSKLWYSLIFSRHFTNLFLASPSSSTKPFRSIVSFVNRENFIGHKFISTSSLPHVDRSDTSITIFDQILDIPKMMGYFVSALRGLLCVRLGSRRVQIRNLTTTQRVTLPIICSQLLDKRKHAVWTSFGYDPIQDEYKVFNIISVLREKKNIIRSEHQVLVLGPQASWRNTKGHTISHRPDSRGIFINGVFYYRARLGKNKCAIMSFDFNSEDFKLIELPFKTNKIWDYKDCSSLMNYKDKVAVFVAHPTLWSDPTMSVDLWVMEDDAEKIKWSKSTIVLPIGQMGLVGYNPLRMRGTGRCNEIMLEKETLIAQEPITCVYFDMEKKKIIKRHIIKLPDHTGFLWDKMRFDTNFWEDDMENIMYLET